MVHSMNDYVAGMDRMSNAARGVAAGDVGDGAVVGVPNSRKRGVDPRMVVVERKMATRYCLTTRSLRKKSSSWKKTKSRMWARRVAE